jgi:hypothetical protein
MKIPMYVFLLTLAFTAGSARANDVASKNQHDTGRFQLFQGQYTTYDLKRQQTAKTDAVFLVDTVTGQVKRYVNKIDEDGRYIETWVSTDLPAFQEKKK